MDETQDLQPHEVMKPEDALLARPYRGEDMLDDKDFDKVVRRFMRMVAQAGIMREVRRREAFEPASVKRRRKQAEARTRRRR